MRLQDPPSALERLIDKAFALAVDHPYGFGMAYLFAMALIGGTYL